MTARDVLETNIDPDVPADMAKASIDDFAAEVRAEAAADVHRAQLPQFPADETPENVAKVVRAVDVRLAERGPDAPYGVPADATPDFFQPGHTYAGTGGEDWRFRCDTITTHPEEGDRTALGWRFFNGLWEATAYHEDEWDVHQAAGTIDVTEAEQVPAPLHYDKVPDPADGCHWCACGNRWPCKNAPAVTT